MYDELVKELRELSHEFYLDDNNEHTETKLKEAADAIEEMNGFVQEAERDRDEYRERLDKSNDAIEELSKPKTNADRIRAMSDDEIAKIIAFVQSEAYAFGLNKTALPIDYPNTFLEWIDWMGAEAT